MTWFSRGCFHKCQQLNLSTLLIYEFRLASNVTKSHDIILAFCNQTGFRMLHFWNSLSNSSNIAWTVLWKKQSSTANHIFHTRFQRMKEWMILFSYIREHKESVHTKGYSQLPIYFLMPWCSKKLFVLLSWDLSNY